MAELACLRRSFSHPSETSHEFSEGDPIRALGESISFGRYMSETLAWEKWSTFSHNRYLEEAEKSSKPGSVAKMKAYFEDHYRKIGAKKQAVLEQANNDSVYVEPEVEGTHNVELVSSSNSPVLNPESAIPNNHSIAHEFPKKDTPNVEPLPSVIVSSSDTSIPTKESHEEAYVVEPSLNVNSKDCMIPEVQMYQSEDAEANASITESSIEINVNQSRDGLENECIFLVTSEKVVTIEKEAKKDKLDTRSKQGLADLSSKSSKRSKMSKISSSLARLATPVRPVLPKKDASGCHKSRKESVEDKKTTSKVQMSINVNSDAKLIKKSSPISHKTGIGKVFTPLGKIIRESFVHTPAPSTSRASVNSSTRHPCATPQTETRRSRIALEKSFARNRTSENVLQSPSVGNMKSPAHSSITFSPFSFRTEERAAKRREFFERRLEREAENLQFLDRAKVKPKTDFRKLSQSVNFSNAAVDSKSALLSDKAKIPLARPQPQPPKCTSKPSTNLVRGKRSQPRQGSIDSTPATGNIKSITVTLPTTKRQENACPNIL